MLGIDRDGSFAEQLCVPAANALPIPDVLSLRVAAYTEPVAAALAVVDVAGPHLDREAPGLIYGRNRIAELTRRILVAHGFSRLTMHDHHGPPPPRDAFAFAIETVATSVAIRDLVTSLHPRGALVLKSRTPSPIEIDLPSLVRKEISLHAVNYGSFTRSIDLLASERVRVDDLLGDDFSLSDHERAFTAARGSEQAKIMFRMSSER
jgi:threonine dehydrogenase-like Zn-dependent dehydrogenase